MRCDAFEIGRCASCTRLSVPYDAQIAAKQARAAQLLAPFGPARWHAPACSREAGFRNKAKMVVAGSVDQPTLGILDASGRGVDLTDCPLYPAALTATFPTLAAFIARARITPYDVPSRRGELKYLLVTLAEHSGDLMLRFVLRSREPLSRIAKYLPELRQSLPGLRAVSANLQPEHKAVIEGETEIPLGGEETLTMRVNGLPLHLRPRSFFQTNTEVAAALYRQAHAWIAAADPAALWDLYCGVGGFALHCADGRRDVTGIEISHDAIASACRSRDELELARVAFHAADATAFACQATALPPAVIVNPPRRGLGNALCQRLRDSETRWILYSSCNVDTLARDLAGLAHFRIDQARLFDMFPHTDHVEVACLLERIATR